jgi:uncharacterized protein
MNTTSNKFRQTRMHFLPLLMIALFTASPSAQADAIHDAARAGDLVKIQKLVVQGADVNAKSIRNETPLILAAIAGQGDIVNYLLQRGADINARNSSGLTALHAAAYAGNVEIVSLLIAKGAAVNDAANRFESTPLILASEENHIAVVKSLLEHGAYVNLVEVNGISATSKAGWREHWELLKLLLANGATCQPIEYAGDWLYQECTKLANAN